MSSVTAADSRSRGFTLLEVMCATIILSLGLVALLTAFMQCQRIMRTTQGFETAQYVLMLGETLYPLPSPDLVTDDPLDNEMLNIDETSAMKLAEDLEIDRELSRDRREELEHYTFERMVDEVDDEELERSGWLYTVRTTIRWGQGRSKDRSETTVITLWRKKR